MEGRLILIVTALTVSVTRGTAQMNITAIGCGVTKWCVEIPDGCDPAGNQNCLFASVANSTPVTTSGTTLSINLKGQSSGYIALVINASEATTLDFVCGQNSSNNGTFFFSTMQKNNTNGAFIPTNNQLTTAMNNTGSVNGSVIQCTFSFSINDTITSYSILLGNGTYNTSGFGSFVVFRNSGPLNLTNLNSNVNNASGGAGTTVTSPTVTSPTVAVTNTTGAGNFTTVHVSTGTGNGTTVNGTTVHGATGAGNGTTVNGTTVNSTTVHGSTGTGNGTTVNSTTVHGSTGTGNGTTVNSTTVHGSTGAGNGTSVNGTTGSTLTALIPTVPTTKTTGASCPLYPYAVLLLLSVLSLSVLQEI